MIDDTPPREPAPSKPDAPAASERGAHWERDTLERLMFATLKEQRQARIWRSTLRVAWLAFLAMASLGGGKAPPPIAADCEFLVPRGATRRTSALQAPGGHFHEQGSSYLAVAKNPLSIWQSGN